MLYMYLCIHVCIYGYTHSYVHIPRRDGITETFLQRITFNYSTKGLGVTESYVL